MLSKPKVRETDESTAARDDVARYEQLRARVLGGDPAGWRLGLAVLQHRGVMAWARASEASATAPTAAGSSVPVAAGDELVSALASMALACLSRR